MPASVRKGGRMKKKKNKKVETLRVPLYTYRHTRAFACARLTQSRTHRHIHTHIFTSARE